MNFDEWRKKHAETDDDTDAKLAWDYQQARIDSLQDTIVMLSLKIDSIKRGNYEEDILNDTTTN